MKELFKALLDYCLVPLVITFSAILATAAGALSGFVVGWIFPETMNHFASLFGFEEPWQLGVVLGFIGIFLRQNTLSRVLGETDKETDNETNPT